MINTHMRILVSTIKLLPPLSLCCSLSLTSQEVPLRQVAQLPEAVQFPTQFQASEKVSLSPPPSLALLPGPSNPGRSLPSIVAALHAPPFSPQHASKGAFLSRVECQRSPARLGSVVGAACWLPERLH
jgi:hypothetical protein